MPSKDRGIFERPPGSDIWWIHWYDHMGRRHRQKIGTQADAKRKRGEVKALVYKIKKGMEHPRALFDAKFLTLEELGEGVEFTLGDFIDSCKPELISKKTWGDLSRFSEKWKKMIGHLKLTEVKAQHAVLRRTKRLEQGIAPATCNRETEFLRAILNKAVRDGHLLANPLARLKDLPEDNKRVRWLRFDEEARLQEVLNPERFEIVAFAMDMGLRRSKIFNLAWFDVHFEDAGWVEVREAKAGSSRQIPFMTTRVRELLERRKESQKGPWVFPSTARYPSDHPKSGERCWDDPRNGDAFCKQWFRPAVISADIHDLTFHDLRHTFCSRLVMAGVPLRTVMELAGHKNFQTTLRYAHLAPENFAAASIALNEYNQAKMLLRAVK